MQGNWKCSLIVALLSFVLAEQGRAAQQQVIERRAGLTGNTLTCRWTFGDGGCPGGENPQHVYAQAGTYPVRLVVHDGAASAAVTQHVTITGVPAG